LSKKARDRSMTDRRTGGQKQRLMCAVQKWTWSCNNRQKPKMMLFIFQRWRSCWR